MLEEIIAKAKDAILSCPDLATLQQVKAEFLGKKGLLTTEAQKMGKLAAAERKSFGQQLNRAKTVITELLDSRNSVLKRLELAAKLEQQKLDLSLSAKAIDKGGLHPITQCLDELTQVFAKYGFEIKGGPSIEDDWHNFTALNIAEDHPARQMHDTFYMNGGKLLRTHTSTIQVRAMTGAKPPFRFIAPGRVYRCDSDMTHTPMFHQIEGVLIDKDITMSHLKYVIIDSLKSYFERDDIEVQFRPSFFPFTEPSAEVDIRMSKTDDWLEVLGCGMMHPNVLRNVGVDPELYQGFAFGFGLERLAMLKYGIKDLRDCFDGDARWLQHYNFGALDIPNLARGLTR